MMDFFIIPQHERLEIAGLDARCNFCTERNASFSFYFDDVRDDRHCEIGWLDVHWVTRKHSNEVVYLRLCLFPDFATLNRCNQIRADVYARLGIPLEIAFDYQIVSKEGSVDLIDDRYCIASGVIEGLPANRPLLVGGGRFPDVSKR